MICRKKATWLPVLLIFMLVPASDAAIRSANVTKPDSHYVVQWVFKRDKPINCEDLGAALDIAIIDWRKLQGTHMILISRLGTGEKNRNLNRQRLEYVEEYLQKKDVEYVFAEGAPVKGLGRFEVYVGGRLTMSFPVAKGQRRLCWGSY